MHCYDGWGTLEHSPHHHPLKVMQIVEMPLEMEQGPLIQPLEKGGWLEPC